MRFIQILSVWIFLVLAGILAFGCFLSNAQELPIKKTTTQNDIERIGKAATVEIVVKTPDGVLGSGSGFFIQQGLIVTNIHVVAGIHGKPQSCSAKLINRTTEYNIKGVMASDPEHDLVILKTEAEAVSRLQLSDSSLVKLGDKVYALGTPWNKPSEIVKGTIKQITPNYFRVKATLPSGYSGGPVLNDVGDVIAVCVSGGENQRYGYVIPSNYLKAMLKDVPFQEQPLEKWREEPSIRAYGIVKQADVKMQLGKYEEAIQGYDAAIYLIPDFTVAYTKRAAAKINVKDYKGVIKDYDAAIRLGDIDIGIYINRSNAKRALGKYIGALQDCETAIHLDPESAEAYINRGDALVKLENYKMAIQDYNTAISLKPERFILAMIYLKRAAVKAELGNKISAIQDYNKVIHLQTNNTHILKVAYLNRGIAKLNIGKNKEAISDFDVVIRMKPNSGILQNAYINRAAAKSELGDNLGSVKDYNEAIRISAGNTKVTAYIYSKRAAVKVKIGDNNEAIEDCDSAIQLHSDIPEAYKIRGDAKYNLFNYKEAIKDYDTAIYLQPDYAKAYFQRGKAKIEIDNVLDAKIDFRTALKFAKCEKTQPLKDEIKSAINNLK